MKLQLAIVPAVIFVFCSLASPHLLSAQKHAQRRPEVTYDAYHDTSLPVREYSMATPQGVARERPEHRRPRGVLSDATVKVTDRAEQTYAAPLVSATIGLNFEGTPDSANGSLAEWPPDNNLAVGATQVVEATNTAYEVYDKATGKSVFGPQQISALFTGVPGLCGQGVNSPDFSDPIVVYDQINNRWIITIIGYDSNATTGNECIAVSTSSDAAGKYHRYVFKFGANALNDYPKLGVWPDAYYASYNIYVDSGYTGVEACAYDSAAMLSGAKAKAVCFIVHGTWHDSDEFSLLPANLDGATRPSSGEPNFFVDLFSATSLHLFRFRVDFANPKSSKFTGPTSIAVKAFTMAPGICIPQPGTSQTVDSVGDRLMFRLAYRNFTTHESLVVTHSVQTSKAISGERWYEIRDPNGTPKVFQQGTFTEGGNSLWMGSIAMDKVGDMALGFSESNASTLHPSIAFTGRVPSDPLGRMEAPATIFKGPGSQWYIGRWGDYSSMAIDPTDDCTFWYVNQYIPSTNNARDFHTRVATLKFPTCQ